jgi:hypothetical protein
MVRAVTLAVTALLAAPCAHAGSILPEPEDFRSQKIERQAGETDWPFVEQNMSLKAIR